MISLFGYGVDQSFANVTIYDNSSYAYPSGSGVQSLNSAANLITPSISATVDSIVIGIFNVVANQPFVLKACSDNAGQPSSSCSIFTIAQGSTIPTTGTFGNVTFTGSYAATGNQPFWVVMSSASTSGLYFVQLTGPPVSPSFDGYTQQVPSTFTGPSESYVMIVTGQSVPASVPILSEWTQMALAFMSFGLVFWYQRRESV